MRLSGYFPAAFSAGLVLLQAPALRAAEAASDSGLPQFDTALFPGQIFWLAISFAALYCLMAFVALPGVSRTQAKRQQMLDNDLGLAAKANEEAKAILAHYEKSLAEARAKAQAMVSEMTTQATQETTERQAAQQQQLAKRIVEAEGRIAATRDAAIREVHEMAFDLASAMVEKVAGMKLAPTHAVKR